MPRPLGRDRLEPSTDGTVVVLSFRPKPWSAREESADGALLRTGTAVRWDDELYEVLRIERRGAGGFRHVLAPWDERLIMWSRADYGVEDSAAPAPPPQEPGGAAPAGSGSSGQLSARWTALPEHLRGLLLGGVPALLLGWFLPFRVMGEGISFLVHELGHTVTAWAFGCSAMPAIVMTIAFEQSRAMAVLIWGAIIFAAVRYRRAQRWNLALGAVAAVYPIIAFTRAHITAFDLGGHLAELGFAAWAFRRALGEDRPEWERPVWSFFGTYLAFRNLRLFGGVAMSEAARTDYLTVAITGENDLVKVATTTGLSLPAVAAGMALLTAVPVAALVLALRRRPLE